MSKELDNQHLTWSDKMNKEQDFKFEHLLNGTLLEKIKTMKQIELNDKIRNAERIPCDPASLWSTKCLPKYLVKDKYIYIVRNLLNIKWPIYSDVF